METTLIILKPDTVQRRLVGRLLTRFEDKGLNVIGMKLVHLKRELAEEHYLVHKGKPFYDNLIRYITSNPVVIHAATAGMVGRNDEDQLPDLRRHGQHVVVETLK